MVRMAADRVRGGYPRVLGPRFSISVPGFRPRIYWFGYPKYYGFGADPEFHPWSSIRGPEILSPLEAQLRTLLYKPEILVAQCSANPQSLIRTQARSPAPPHGGRTPAPTRRPDGRPRRPRQSTTARPRRPSLHPVRDLAGLPRTPFATSLSLAACGLLGPVPASAGVGTHNTGAHGRGPVGGSLTALCPRRLAARERAVQGRRAAWRRSERAAALAHPFPRSQIFRFRIIRRVSGMDFHPNCCLGWFRVLYMSFGFWCPDIPPDPNLPHCPP